MKGYLNPNHAPKKKVKIKETPRISTSESETTKIMKVNDPASISINSTFTPKNMNKNFTESINAFFATEIPTKEESSSNNIFET